MAKFVSCRCENHTAINQRKSANFRPPASDSSDRTAVVKNQVSTINDNEVNIRLDIKNLVNLVKYFISRVVLKIVPLGMSPIDAIHPRLALRIGFNAEGIVALALRLHLLGIEGLNVENLIFHLLNHLGAIRTVVGFKVDHPHGAGFAPVEILNRLTSRAGMIAPPLLVIE